MKKLIFLLIGINLISSTDTYSPQIEKYVSFLKQDHKNALDYIIGLWDNYDIVIICERMHPENTQYQLIIDVIKDSRFINNVGNIFTEIGTMNMQDEVNKFVKRTYSDSTLFRNDALEIHRNIATGDRPIWMMYNFYYLITEINKINSDLPKKLKMNLFVSDIPFQGWQNIYTQRDFKNYADFMRKTDRDSTLALNIISKISALTQQNKKKAKSLIILNYRHAFRKNYVGNYNYRVSNAAKIIFDKFPMKTANIYLNSFAERPSNKTGNEEIDSLYCPVQGGKWDAAFKVLSLKSIGFDFQDSPFGKDSFDYIPIANEFTYQDMFTGFVYYLPFEEHSCIWGVPGIVTSEFRKEYLRRYKLLYPNNDTTTIKKELEYLNTQDIQKYPWTVTATKMIDKWTKQ